jgi:hypothetical protein
MLEIWLSQKAVEHGEHSNRIAEQAVAFDQQDAL